MKKGAVILAVVLAALACLAIVLLIGGVVWARAYGGYGPQMMMGGFGHPRSMGLFGVFGGGLMLLVLFGLIAGGITLLVVGLTGRKQPGPEGGATPLDILKRRYAAGEIDREEYERMREELLS